MPLFYVSFEKHIEFTVVAVDKDELVSAVEDLDDYDIENDFWGAEGSWERHVHEPIAGGKARPDCGVFDGRILDYGDYLAEIEDEDPEDAERRKLDEQAKHTLELFEKKE